MPPTSSRNQHDTQELYRLQFTGTGAEYFRIWVVNLLLTILTFGIYSAWAKVRRLQYFYRNTQFAGAIFDYHGNPKAILKGRILAFVLIAAYKISSGISMVATVVVVVILTAITPWLLARAFRFKMVNSSYRGLRFNFNGSVKDAYRNLILFPVVLGLMALFIWSVVESFSKTIEVSTLILLGLISIFALAATVPWAHYFLKRYQFDHAYFGQTPFFNHVKTRSFFNIYARSVGFLLLGSTSVAIFGFFTSRLYAILSKTMFGWLFTFLYGMLSAYVFYMLVRAFLESRLQNLVWNHAEIAEHRFESTVSARQLLWIHVSNLIFISLSFGLYKPFAVIRLLKYKIESMALIPHGDLESFLGDQSVNDESAIGQEAGDFFDIDIAL